MSPVTLRLRELREARGLTQAELAEATGLRRPTISELENGRTRHDTLDLLDRLCTALDCSPGELLARTKPSGRRKGKR